ncbi:hypothetical protein AI2BBH_07810 [Alistipes indistinctus]|nr:hypothetical protein AI2BBH_07810 [Alistipes indistinctus]
MSPSTRFNTSRYIRFDEFELNEVIQADLDAMNFVAMPRTKQTILVIMEDYDLIRSHDGRNR